LWFEDKDKDLSLKDEDKDKDLKIGPRGSSRTRTFFKDNNTALYWPFPPSLPLLFPPFPLLFPGFDNDGHKQ